MDIEQIRAKVKTGDFTITDHAMIESFKDGIPSMTPYIALNTARSLKNTINESVASYFPC